MSDQLVARSPIEAVLRLLRALWLLPFLAGPAETLQAQNSPLFVTGKVVDSVSGNPLAGVNVLLLNLRDSSLRAGGSSDREGLFKVAIPAPGPYRLRATYVGYSPLLRLRRFTEAQNLGVLLMKPLSSTLEEVPIEGMAKRVEQRGDTTEIQASGFKTAPDADAEQLLRKMPGITYENGQIKAQGEEIKRVLLDGQEFYGNDATAALRNLPADAIEKVQLIDRLSDQAQFSGINDGNTEKTLNLITRTGLNNSRFGKVYGGLGDFTGGSSENTENAFRQGLKFDQFDQDFTLNSPASGSRFMSGGNASYFKGRRRISAAALWNNINQQNFSGTEIAGLLGGGGGMAGGAGGMGGMRGMGGTGRGGQGGGMGADGSAALLNPTQKGLTETASLALNLSQQWTGGWKVNSALVLTGSTNEQNAATVRQWLNLQGLYQADSSRQIQRNTGQRWTARLEWTPDSNRALIVSPRWSRSTRRALSSSLTQSDSLKGPEGTSDLLHRLSENTLRSLNQSNQLSGGGELVYRQKLAKPRRNFSVNWSVDWQNQAQPREQRSILLSAGPAPILPPVWWQYADSAWQTFDQDRNLLRSRWDLNFIEPLGKRSLMEWTLSPLLQYSSSGQVYDDHQNRLHRPLFFEQELQQRVMGGQYGVRYRLGDDRQEWTLGVQRQEYQLSNRLLSPNPAAEQPLYLPAWLPNASWRYSPDKQKQYRIFYRSSTQLPSVQQMQTVLDNSNPMSVSVGNPELTQALTHQVGGRFRWTRSERGQSLFAFASASLTGNSIGNETWVVPADTGLMRSWWEGMKGPLYYAPRWQDLGLVRGAQLGRPANLGTLKAVRFYGTYSHPWAALKSTMNWTLMGSVQSQPLRSNLTSSEALTQSATGSWGLASSQTETVDYQVTLNGGWNRFRNQGMGAKGPWTTYWTHSASGRVQLTLRQRWVLGSDYAWTYLGGLNASFNASVHLVNLSMAVKVLPSRLGEIRLSVFDVFNQNRALSRTLNEVFVEDNRNTALTQFVMLAFTYNFRNFGKPTRQNTSDLLPAPSHPGGHMPGGSPDQARPWGNWR